MKPTTRLLTALLLSSGAVAAYALAGGSGAPTTAKQPAAPAGSSRIVNINPVVLGNSFVSPLVELFGDVSIGQKSFIAGNTTVSAEPGTRVCIGSETNLQDNILFLAQRRLPFKPQASVCGNMATLTGNRVSIAHQASIINSKLGDFVFVGFHSRVESSVLENGVFVLHGAVVRGVRIAQNRLVPSGAVITTQAQADALPLKAEANSEFQNDVLDVNAEFAEGYIEQYKVGGLDAVSGVTAAPRTSWNPRPVRPTLGQGVSVEEFVRIVGDVRLGANSSVGRRSSIRADEGAPIIIGANSSIEDQVTFHALKGTTIVVGSGLNASDNIVFHGPLTVGDNLTIGDDSVVFRSKIGNNVTIGENALVIDVTLPDGAVVPDGARILKQADADALKK